jgi:hypothetical protein
LIALWLNLVPVKWAAGFPGLEESMGMGSQYMWLMTGHRVERLEHNSYDGKVRQLYTCV